MRVDHVGRPGCGEEAPDSDGVHAVQSHNVCCRLAEQTCESGLAGWVAHRLCEGSRGDGDAGGSFLSAGEHHNEAAVVAVQSNESAGVEGHSAGHAAPVCCPWSRTLSAQARSWADSSPPVLARASLSLDPPPRFLMGLDGA
jgi:hypothetical protein